MRTEVRLAGAFWLALCLQFLPWSQVTADARALALACVTAALVLGVGLLGRRAAWPVAGVLAVQAVAAAVALLAGVGVTHGDGVWLRLPAVIEAGFATIESSAAPMAPDPGVTLLVGLLGALLAWTADWLAVAPRRPGGAVAPLLVPYAVVAVALATPMLFAEFALFGLGVGLVLLAGWAPAGRDHGVRVVAWAAAVATIAAALGLTWLAGRALPALEAPQARQTLQMSDPSLDLKRNLVQGSDDVIIRYASDASTGSYLKLATLPAFTAEGFGLTDVRVATGRIPSPPGLSGGGTQRQTRVEVGDFASEWLPVPYAPARVRAPGDWGFALDTLDVMALAGPDRGNATRGISYEVTSVDVRPGADEIARADASRVEDPELHLALPAEVPQRIRSLALDITADAPTAGAKAQAIEQYLTSGQFTYSTARSVGIGDGIATIADFLFGSRRGYCEQFAGAMAILARAAGVPSRMAVGFTAGTRAGDGWEVTARDMHTWPEIWLDGWGWVAFEPTPGGGGTATEAQPSAGASAPVTSQATEAATPTPTEQTPTPTPAATPEPGAGAAGAGLPGWAGWLLGVLALAAAVAALVLGPRLRRRRRRARRLLGTGDARVDTLSAWDEVRDTAGDLGLGWPDGSPRFAAERLVPRLGGDREAAEALRRLAAAAERGLYDHPGAYHGNGRWAEEVGVVVAALEVAARGTGHAQRRKGEQRRA